MIYRVTIDMDGDAFQGGGAGEVAQILLKLAGDVAMGDGFDRDLFDSGGSRVGEAAIDEGGIMKTAFYRMAKEGPGEWAVWYAGQYPGCDKQDVVFQGTWHACRAFLVRANRTGEGS